MVDFFSNLSFEGDLAAVLCPLLNTCSLLGPGLALQDSETSPADSALEEPLVWPRLRTGDPTDMLQHLSWILPDQKFTE